MGSGGLIGVFIILYKIGKGQGKAQQREDNRTEQIKDIQENISQINVNLNNHITDLDKKIDNHIEKLNEWREQTAERIIKLESRHKNI